MAWEAPNIDWSPTQQGVGNGDMNRIENNTLLLNETATKSGIKKYPDIFAGNPIAGGALNIRVAGTDTVFHSESSVAGAVSGPTFNIQKILSSSNWAAGTGASTPCKAPGATFGGSSKFWSIFLLWNPATETTDIALDTSVTGFNISGSSIEAAGYTQWVNIGTVYENNGASFVNTYGVNNVFSVADDNERFFNVSGTTLCDITSLVSNFKRPVTLEIRTDGFLDNFGTLKVWSAAHGVTVPNAQTLYFDGDPDQIHQCSVVPYQGEIYISSTFVASVVVYVRLISWAEGQLLL